jgi:hypothetical protein
VASDASSWFRTAVLDGSGNEATAFFLKGRDAEVEVEVEGNQWRLHGNLKEKLQLSICQPN